MVVEWIVEYAGKEVGHMANLEASLAASLVRSGKVRVVKSGEPMHAPKPKTVTRKKK